MDMGGSAEIVYLNAIDGDAGERAFAQLSLPGHPGFVVFDAEGRETYRAVGIVEADELRAALGVGYTETPTE
jgi:hypothetical protein